MNVGALSDQELMASLHGVVGQSRRMLAALLLHLGEVEERRLELASACPSMFEFCVRRLGMSDGEACRRIAAARLLKRFPRLLSRIESGALNLTTIHLLRDVLTESTLDAVVEAASGKTKREVEALVARLAPRPDVPPTITELPTPARVFPGIDAPLPPAPKARIAPLSEERFEVRFTAGRALRDKIERAQDLLRHSHPNGDLEAIMYRAFGALLDQLEKTRRGKATRPQENPRPTTTDAVPRAVVREVFERDGEQCTFTDEQGNRCPAKGFLQLDHALARAKGGGATVPNMRVYCRAHNRYHAERDFGREHIESKIHHRQRGCDVVEQTHFALVKMGFRQKDVTRALATLMREREALPPIEALLREALAALT